MAFIQYDDCLELLVEFRALTKLLDGDEDKARGMLIRFMRLARRVWKEPQGIPITWIKLGEFQAILDSGWGFLEGDFVHSNDAIDDLLLQLESEEQWHQ